MTRWHEPPRTQFDRIDPRHTWPRTSAFSVAGLIAAAIVTGSCGGSGREASAEADRLDSASNAAAREIVASVIHAAGGRENLDAIRTLAVQYVRTVYPSQDDDRSSPAMPRSADVVQVRDFDTGRHLYEVYSGDEPETWERVVILPNGAFGVNLLTNETTPLASDALTSANYGGIQLRWYVYAALSEASTAGPNLRHARDTMLNGRNQHILTYPGVDTQTIELWVDEELSLIVRRQISASNPILGQTVARLEFGDYQNVGGVPMPMDIAVYRGNHLFERFEMQEIRLNATIQESAFEPPAP